MITSLSYLYSISYFFKTTAGARWYTTQSNPVNNTLYIKLDKFPQMSVYYTLYDIQGKELSSGSFDGQEHEINMSQISKGIYFIRCATENQPATK